MVLGNTNDFTYTFHGNPRATFAQFFGNSAPFTALFNDFATTPGSQRYFGFDDDQMDTDLDPFASLNNMGPTRPGNAFRSQSFNFHHNPTRTKDKAQDPPIEHDLYVNLEDIAKGCVKKMKISRRVLQQDGSTKKEDKVLTITVKPGWKAGTRITFQREGDQSRHKIPADIVFTIRDKPHPQFKREGSDLRYTASITLKQALYGCVIKVPTMNGDKVTINFTNEIVNPKTVKRLQGYGLPLPKEPSRKGDLIVNFDIKFPEQLSQSARDIIADIFP